MKKNKLMTFGIFTFIGLILIIALSNSTFLTINAGEKGVLFRTFGGGLDTEKVFEQGFHIIAPWNDMYVYDVRETQLEESMTVLSSNGLNIKVDVTVRLHRNTKKSACCMISSVSIIQHP